MCKKTRFYCDKKGCNYHVDKEKNNFPIDLGLYPREFKTVKINKQKYKLCPKCYKQLQKMKEKFIIQGGKNNELQQKRKTTLLETNRPDHRPTQPKKSIYKTKTEGGGKIDMKLYTKELQKLKKAALIDLKNKVRRNKLSA